MESNGFPRLGSSNFSILAPALPPLSIQEGGERKGLAASSGPLCFRTCFHGSVP